jgi:hypothetical protein
MPNAFQLVPGVAALVGLGVLALFVRRAVKAWLALRGTRVVVCPDNRELVAVAVDAAHAAFSASGGRVELRLESCTRWPEKAGCGQECLGQIESAPEACLLRNILADWYGGKRCALCGRSFELRHWHDHRPALLAPGGALVDWTGFRPEQVVDVLATHRPVCWDCRIAEGFRREHPDLVVDRPAQPAASSSGPRR